MRGNRTNHGWSTRYKFYSLPKYVYLFQSPTSRKKFRVCKKINGRVVTLGYYHTLEEAEKVAKVVAKMVGG